MTDDLDVAFYRASRYAIPRDQALAEIRQRRAEFLNGATPTPPPEPDLTQRDIFAPAPELAEPPSSEPSPTERDGVAIFDDPDTFAEEFFERLKDKHASPAGKPKSPTVRKGRKPKGEGLTSKHDKFGVIDGADDEKE